MSDLGLFDINRVERILACLAGGEVMQGHKGFTLEVMQAYLVDVQTLLDDGNRLRDYIAELRAKIKEVKDERDALKARAAGLEAARQWRDPETAPIGKMVLLKIRARGYWNDEWYVIIGGVPEEDDDHDRWLNENGEEIKYVDVLGWQPLPEAGEPAP